MFKIGRFQYNKTRSSCCPGRVLSERAGALLTRAQGLTLGDFWPCQAGLCPGRCWALAAGQLGSPAPSARALLPVKLPSVRQRRQPEAFSEMVYSQTLRQAGGPAAVPGGWRVGGCPWCWLVGVSTAWARVAWL